MNRGEVILVPHLAHYSVITTYLMKHTAICLAFLVMFGLVPTHSAAAEAPPGVVGGPESTDGRLLLGELNCAACHDPGAAAARLFSKQSPFLGEVGARVTPEYLRAFLAAPQKVKPATPMPDLLHHLPPDQRETTVEDLVHFLVSLGGPMGQAAKMPNPKVLDRGKALYHTVGCVACHQPFEPAPKHKIDPNAPPADEEPDKAAPLKSRVFVPLGNLPLKTTPQALALFLANPLHVRPSGRMPSLGLTAEEARAIAAYLLRDQAGKEKPAPPAFLLDATRASGARDLFARVGCASCHDTGSRKEPERLDLVLLGASGDRHRTQGQPQSAERIASPRHR